MFPLYADENVRGALLSALRMRGWDLVLAVDVLPGEKDDEVHLIRAPGSGRVLVTNDEDLLGISARWMKEGRAFPGLIYWGQHKYKKATLGEIVRKIEVLDPADLPNRVHFL